LGAWWFKRCVALPYEEAFKTVSAISGKKLIWF